jgi:DNA (cytosine-5)-methyltransferase 1
LFGYPENYEIPGSEMEAFDLLGNTVPIPVVEAVSSKIAELIPNNPYFTESLRPVCSA